MNFRYRVEEKLLDQLPVVVNEELSAAARDQVLDDAVPVHASTNTTRYSVKARYGVDPERWPCRS